MVERKKLVETDVVRLESDRPSNLAAYWYDPNAR